MLAALSFESITIDNISSFYNQRIEVEVLRLDKISPVISGNKWFKLQHYLEEALTLGKKGILTFGGAWSNHIIATAAACKEYNLDSIGIIRGEEPKEKSYRLEQAQEFGMKLIYISRSDYQLKKIPAGIDVTGYYMVNEGGYGSTGAKGASTLLDYCNKNYTHYCCAVGTGTMMAGIINRIHPDQKVVGISVMKNNLELENMIQELTKNNKENWQILHDYSFGGYAKHQPALLQFMNKFYRHTGVLSDFVYTGKLFFAITDLIEKNYFPTASRLLLIHSGGLQGNRSLPAETLLF
jgi:1-aminocyclopropane-1-carboxylate deaminase